MTAISPIHMKGAALLAGLSLMLSSCFVSPGKFTSELTLLEDDQFTFTYDGEVYFLGLSQLVQEAQERERSQREFTSYCYGPEEEAVEDVAEAAASAATEAAEAAEAAATEAANAAEEAASETVEIVEAVADDDYGRRDCTPEEEAQQRKEWEEREERRRERNRQQSEQISNFIGGIDPTNPEAEQELAKLLLRQKGFDSVVAKGDGLFEISYSIKGTLSHDYMFPMMEGFPTSSPFMQLFLRDGDQVRVNAPGLAPQSVNNPIMPLMLMGPGLRAGGTSGEEALDDIPVVDGTFSIVTTGEILANNTDEGPTTEGARKRLTWTINQRSTSTPTALIAMPRR